MILSSSHVGLSSRLVGRNRECPKCWAPWVSSRTFETWRSSNSSNSSNSSKRAVTAVTAVSGRRVSGNHQIWRSCSGAPQTYHLPFHLSSTPKMPSPAPHGLFAVQLALQAGTGSTGVRCCCCWPLQARLRCLAPCLQPNRAAQPGLCRPAAAAASSSQQQPTASSRSRQQPSKI